MADVAIESQEDTSEHGAAAALHILGVLPSTSTGTAAAAAAASVTTSHQLQHHPQQDVNTSSRDVTGQCAGEGSTLAAISSTAAYTSSSEGAEATEASQEAQQSCIYMPSYGTEQHQDQHQPSYGTQQPQHQHQPRGRGAMAAAAVAELLHEHREASCAIVAAVEAAADGLSSPAARKSPAKSNRGGRSGRKGGRSHLVCKVDGCSTMLSSSKAYYQRHRVCAAHLGAMVARVDGVDSRFCQQCGKFQPLEEFDNDKRSCRSRLKRHNNRRREQRHSKGIEFTMLAMAAAAAAAKSSDGGGDMVLSAGPGAAAAVAAAAGHAELPAAADLAAAQAVAEGLNPGRQPNLGLDDSCNAGSKYDASPLLPPGSLAAVPPKRTQMRRSSATRALEALRMVNAASSNSISSDFEGENTDDGHQRSPLAVASTAQRKRVLKRPGSAGGDLMDGVTQHTEGFSKAAYQRFSHPGFMAGTGIGPRCNLFSSLAAVSYAGDSSVDMAAGSSRTEVHALPERGSEHLPPGLETSGLYDRVQPGGLSRFAPQYSGAVPSPYGQQQWQQQQQQPNLGYPNIGLPRFDTFSGWGRPQQQRQQWPGQQQQHYPPWEMPRAEQQRLQRQGSTAFEGLPAAAAAVEGDYTLHGSTAPSAGEHCKVSSSTAAAAQQYTFPDDSTKAAHGRLPSPCTAAAPAQDAILIAEQHRMPPDLRSTGSGKFFAGAATRHCARYSDLGTPVAAAAAAVLDGRKRSFPGSWVPHLQQQQQEQQEEEEEETQFKTEEHSLEHAPGYATAQRRELLNCCETNHHQQQQHETGNQETQPRLHYSSVPLQLQQQQADTAIQAMPTAAVVAGPGVSHAVHDLYESSSTFANQALQPHQQLVHPHNLHGTYSGQSQQQQQPVHSNVNFPEFSQPQSESMQLPAVQQQQQQISLVPMFSNRNSNVGGQRVFSPLHPAPQEAARPAAAAAAIPAVMPAAARGSHAMVSPFAHAYTVTDQHWQQQQLQATTGVVPGYGMANPRFAGSDHDLCSPMYSGSAHDQGDPRFSAAGSETFSATGVLRSNLAGINLGSGPAGSVQLQLQHQQYSSSWTGTEQQHSSVTLDAPQQHLEVSATCATPAAVRIDPETATVAERFSHPGYISASAAVSAAAAAGQGSVDPNTIEPPATLPQTAAAAAEHQATAVAAAGSALPVPDSAMFNSMSADEDFGELLELLLEGDEQHNQLQLQQTGRT